MKKISRIILLLTLLIMFLIGSYILFTSNTYFKFLVVSVWAFFIVFIIGLYMIGKNITFKAKWFEYLFFVFLFIASAILTNQGVLMTLGKNIALYSYSYMIIYSLAISFGLLHYIFQLDGK